MSRGMDTIEIVDTAATRGIAPARVLRRQAEERLTVTEATRAQVRGDLAEIAAQLTDRAPTPSTLVGAQLAERARYALDCARIGDRILGLRRRGRTVHPLVSL